MCLEERQPSPTCQPIAWLFRNGGVVFLWLNPKPISIQNEPSWRLARRILQQQQQQQQRQQQQQQQKPQVPKTVLRFPNTLPTLRPPKQKQLVWSICHALCEAGRTCFSFSLFLPLAGSVQGCAVLGIVFYGAVLALSPVICGHIHQGQGHWRRRPDSPGFRESLFFCPPWAGWPGLVYGWCAVDRLFALISLKWL